VFLEYEDQRHRGVLFVKQCHWHRCAWLAGVIDIVVQPPLSNNCANSKQQVIQKGVNSCIRGPKGSLVTFIFLFIFVKIENIGAFLRKCCGIL
jgi:hypothetical protein